jgi:hypothetical protein
MNAIKQSDIHTYMGIQAEMLENIAGVETGSDWILIDEEGKVLGKYLLVETATERKWSDQSALKASINMSGSTIFIGGNASLLQGNKTMDGSAHCLVSVATPCKVVTIQASPSNAAEIYIGNSAEVTSSAHMFVLTKGNSVTISCSDLSQLYYIGTASDKLSYGGEV